MQIFPFYVYDFKEKDSQRGIVSSPLPPSSPVSILKTTACKNTHFHMYQKPGNGFKLDKQADNEVEKWEMHLFPVWLRRISSNKPEPVPLPGFSFSSDTSLCVSFDERLCWQMLHLKYQWDFD